MKSPVQIGLVICLAVLAGCARENADLETRTINAAQVIEGQLHDVSCGQCQFGLQGDGCDLAIRMDGKSYFVIGSGIDDHGDAHADNGLCNVVRKARVTGTLIDGKFQADRIELLDVPPPE